MRLCTRTGNVDAAVGKRFLCRPAQCEKCPMKPNSQNEGPGKAREMRKKAWEKFEIKLFFCANFDEFKKPIKSFWLKARKVC